MKKRKLNKSIKQWINFLKKDNNSEEWDWSFLLQMEREKIRRMSVWFEKNGCHVTVGQDVNKMKLAIKLLDIILESPKTQVPYVNIRNLSRFMPESETRWILSQIKTKTTDFGGYTINMEELALDSIRCEKAWYLYSKLRYYFLKSWWD